MLKSMSQGQKIDPALADKYSVRGFIKVFVYFIVKCKMNITLLKPLPSTVRV